jgi:hypothetical protein
VLTDPEAQQHVSFLGGVVSVVRSTPDATATIVLNFTADTVDHPAPDPIDAVVFDSDDEGWGGPGWSADRLGPWSARCSLTHAR